MKIHVDVRGEEVYNFEVEVEEDHNYYVSEAGGLVHNEGNGELTTRILANANDLGVNRAVFNQLENSQHLKAVYDAVLADTGSEEVAAYVVEGYLKEASEGLSGSEIFDASSAGHPEGERGAAKILGVTADGRYFLRDVSYSIEDPGLLPRLIGNEGSAPDGLKINFASEERHGEAGPIYTMIEGNGAFTPPGSSVQQTHRRWLEVIEIDPMKRTTEFATIDSPASGADDYMLGRVRSDPANPNSPWRQLTLDDLNPAERGAALRYMVEGDSNGQARPRFLTQPANPVNTWRTHGQGPLNIWDDRVDPGGVYPTNMAGLRNDLLGAERDHRLSDTIFIPGIGPVRTSRGTIRRLILRNNCVPGVSGGPC